jgi:hypothetical protein
VSAVPRETSSERILARLVEDEQTFITKLSHKYINVYGLNNDWRSTGTVWWTLDMDFREWGVKDVTIRITRAEFEIKLYDDNAEGPHSISVKWPEPVRKRPNELNVKAMAIYYADKPFSVRTVVITSEAWRALTPTLVEIDMQRREIEITF